jgi:hypothetical protein
MTDLQTLVKQTSNPSILKMQQRLHAEVVELGKKALQWREKCEALELALGVEREQVAHWIEKHDALKQDAPLPVQPASSAARTIEDCPELNMVNYDAVDVDRLNDWAIRADAEIDRLAALAQPEQEPCDMGDICIGCSPRNADGSCPSAQPEQGSMLLIQSHREGYWCADLTCKKCYGADFRFKHTPPKENT